MSRRNNIATDSDLACLTTTDLPQAGLYLEGSHSPKKTPKFRRLHFEAYATTAAELKAQEDR